MTEDTTTTTAPEDSGSLADHESAYRASVESGTPQKAPIAAEPAATETAAPAGDDETRTTETTERDERGQFKPRHRAKSQEASVDDVPRIRELTKRLRETEAERDALKQTGKPADESAARVAAPVTPPAPAPAGFPSFEQWASAKENEGKTYEDFIDARADWRYDMRRAAERETEAKTAQERAYQQLVDGYAKQLPAVVKKYPDFDEVVAPGGKEIQVSKVLERAVIEVGPEVAYYLGQNADEREALTDDTLMDATGKVLDASHPGFPAAVAAMKRYLRTLVASEQRSSSPSRTAAAPTGSALALATPPAPRPPNPVRTGALRDADALPTDESSLAEHERAFAPGRRRA